MNPPMNPRHRLRASGATVGLEGVDAEQDETPVGSLAATVNEGDYVVAFKPATDGEREKSPRPRVWKVLRRNSRDINARLEDDPHVKKIQSTIALSKILANLGKDPAPGVVYGTDLSARYLGTKRVDDTITFHVFHRPAKDQLEAFFAGFARVRRRLEKERIGHLLFENVSFELRPKKGGHSGYFKYAPRDPVPIHIAYCLDYLGEYKPDYLVLHEFGHLIEWKLREYKSLWAAWQAVHAASIFPEHVPPEKCQMLLRTLLATRDAAGQSDVPSKGTTPTIKAWRAELEEEDRPHASAVLRWIAQHRKVRPPELQNLLTLNKDKLVQAIWPNEAIETKHSIKPVLSEYATENVSETFAEAFALSFTGTKIPEPIQKLLDKTLTTLREVYATENR